MMRRPRSPRGRPHVSWGLAALWLSGVCHGADTAGPMRDPMRPPSAVQAPVSEPAAAAAAVEITPRHLMVVDGRRYLIVAGRRLGIGDMLGTARIERLDDGSVWLREAGVLRQVSLFGGIVKRATPPPDAASRPEGARPLKTTLPTGSRS
jgi:hypothetical protein